jgi:hypothetical protein
MDKWQTLPNDIITISSITPLKNCKYCGKKLTHTVEFDTCIECQSINKDKAFEHMQLISQEHLNKLQRIEEICNSGASAIEKYLHIESVMKNE